jgi:ERCC4-type nuclease
MSKNDFRITVIADDRESNNNVIRFLANMKNVSVVVRRLSVGDYIVDNQLVFERKTLKDFAQSVVDGRLFKQAIRLVNSKCKSVLILEGTGKELAKIGVRRESIQGALITVSLILGVPVLRSLDSSESAHLIVYASRQIKATGRGVFQRHGYRPKGKRKQQLFILQGLPGIGRERAIRLLDAFGNVEAVVTATSEELQAVEGIGENIAGKIKWAVREELQPYGVSNEFPI